MINISEPQSVDLDVLIEREGLTEVVVVEAVPMAYTWDAVGVYAKDGRFFLLEEGGCSCNFYGDDKYTLERDLKVATREQAIQAVKEVGTADEYGMQDDINRAVEAIRDFR